MRFCDMDLVMWMRCEGSSIEFHMYGVVFGWYVSCVCVLVCGRGGVRWGACGREWGSTVSLCLHTTV